MKNMQRIVILSGAGISAESGINTFRDADGLWEQHRLEDVATPEAWERDPELVLRFYNERRKQLIEVAPNPAHHAITQLQGEFHVDVITQNVDDLHERAGNSNVLHLHGELRKSRSSQNSSRTYDINGWELQMGDRCEDGHQLRPHVVWFGEMVPNLQPAAELVSRADSIIIVGTSLNVYPAAGLYHYAKPDARIWIVDPKADSLGTPPHVTIINEKAGAALPRLVEDLIRDSLSD